MTEQPWFELGPPCEVPGCSGVLVQTINHRTMVFFLKCSKCGEEFYRMPARDALGHAIRTIRRVMKGEPPYD